MRIGVAELINGKTYQKFKLYTVSEKNIRLSNKNVSYLKIVRKDIYVFSEFFLDEIFAPVCTYTRVCNK